MSVWRNNKNSLSVLCGIENDNTEGEFLDNRRKWSRTCIETFGPETFASVFGIDPSTITEGKENAVQLDVNLSELANKTRRIQVLETTSLAEAVALRIVGVDKAGNPEIYESNYKRDRDGNRILHNGKAIYRRTKLAKIDVADLMVATSEEGTNLDVITENVPASVSVEAEQD